MVQAKKYFYSDIQSKLTSMDNLHLKKTIINNSENMYNKDYSGIKTYAQFIVYPTEPISTIEELNQFVQDCMEPLFSSFDYKGAEINETSILKKQNHLRLRQLLQEEYCGLRKQLIWLQKQESQKKLQRWQKNLGLMKEH